MRTQAGPIMNARKNNKQYDPIPLIRPCELMSLSLAPCPAYMVHHFARASRGSKHANRFQPRIQEVPQDFDLPVEEGPEDGDPAIEQTAEDLGLDLAQVAEDLGLDLA